MFPEVLRKTVTDQLDTTLSRWLISAKERATLTALRGYLQSMGAEELDRLAAFLPSSLGGLAADAEDVP